MDSSINVFIAFQLFRIIAVGLSVLVFRALHLFQHIALIILLSKMVHANEIRADLFAINKEIYTIIYLDVQSLLPLLLHLISRLLRL